MRCLSQAGAARDGGADIYIYIYIYVSIYVYIYITDRFLQFDVEALSVCASAPPGTEPPVTKRCCGCGGLPSDNR